MKMGIKEFRERLSEVARGEEPVILTDRGEVIGTYTPRPRKQLTKEELSAWVAEREAFRDTWRARTPDWRERLISAGLDPDVD